MRVTGRYVEALPTSLARRRPAPREKNHVSGIPTLRLTWDNVAGEIGQWLRPTVPIGRDRQYSHVVRDATLEVAIFDRQSVSDSVIRRYSPSTGRRLRDRAPEQVHNNPLAVATSSGRLRSPAPDSRSAPPGDPRARRVHRSGVRSCRRRATSFNTRASRVSHSVASPGLATR